MCDCKSGSEDLPGDHPWATRPTVPSEPRWSHRALWTTMIQWAFWTCVTLCEREDKLQPSGAGNRVPLRRPQQWQGAELAQSAFKPPLHYLASYFLPNQMELTPAEPWATSIRACRHTQLDYVACHKPLTKLRTELLCHHPEHSLLFPKCPGKSQDQIRNYYFHHKKFNDNFLVFSDRKLKCFSLERSSSLLLLGTENQRIFTSKPDFLPGFNRKFATQSEPHNNFKIRTGTFSDELLKEKKKQLFLQDQLSTENQSERDDFQCFFLSTWAICTLLTFMDSWAPFALLL